MIAPEVSYQPLLHNPFPQFSRVAVAPFANQSDEATVDGRQFAMAYFAELQEIRGFEVVPLGVVEEAIIHHAIDLSSPGEARRLAEVLGVDAVVVGAVTDFSPYYPPRCGMRVEWYAANPGFHEIPAGYGLPWGTPEEEYIPEELVFEAEMALARAQMATQTPDCNVGCDPLTPPPMLSPPHNASPLRTHVAPPPMAKTESEHHEGTDEPEPDWEAPDAMSPPLDKSPAAPPAPSQVDPFDEANGSDRATEALPAPPEADPSTDGSAATNPADAGSIASRGGASRKRMGGKVRPANFDAPIDSDAGAIAPDSLTTGPSHAGGATGAMGMLPPGWPDARGFMPPGPLPTRPRCMPQNGPVMTHTRIYRGHDPDFTAALASYVSFRDDARFGGWQSYLERSDDFIRFCAHLHLAEMLTARGGGGETRVARRWSLSR